MEINTYIDHTLLKADASENDVRELIDEAIRYQFKSVCIQPSFVAFAAPFLKGTAVEVCTVIGFPLGANTSATKVFETQDAIKNGATEIDMVINVGKLKDEDYSYVRQEIKDIKTACGSKILKVIIETALLSDAEIVKACTLAVEAGADFVKTSTGFSSAGATVKDVSLMKKTVGERAQVKASGGIRSIQDFNDMVSAGATRIGASSGIAIIEGKNSTESY